MISYDPLWKKLIDLKMSKSELAKVTGLSRTTVSKMAAGESVTLDVIDRICEKLEVPITDVVEIRKS
jgi:DNA-binding Xre family transcriptional regulator